jgi:hypothetical protein
MVIVGYQSFEATYWFNISGSISFGPTGCPETSVINYHPTLLILPGEQWPEPHRGGSLKYRICREFSKGDLTTVEA